MKEKAFNREPEWPGEPSPAPLRAAPVARLRRQARTHSPDVDELVSDFLQELDGFSKDLPLTRPLSTGQSADAIPEAEASLIKDGRDPGPSSRPEVPQKKPEVIYPDVDAEIDRSLCELEARLASKAADKSHLEPVPPEPPIKIPIEPRARPQAPNPAGASMPPKAEAPNEIVFSPGPVTSTESATPLEPDPILFLRNSISQHRKASRRTAIAFAGVILAVAVLVALYFYFAAGSSHSADSLVGSPENASVSGGAIPEGLNPLTPRGGHSLMGSVSPSETTPPGRGMGVAPAAQRGAAAARDDAGRANAPAQQPILNRSRNPSASAANNAGQRPLEIVALPAGTGIPAAPALQAPPPIPAPIAVNPPAAPPVQADSVKSASETSPADAPRGSPLGMSPLSGTGVRSDPPGATFPPTNAPEGKVGSLPLATLAEPLTRIAPVYPLAAARMRITGNVEVRITVDEQGRVTNAAAISGPDLLRPAAEEALRKWRFKPATLRGEKIRSEVIVSVSFVR